MNLLVRLLGVLGIADSLWLTLDPEGWARFWGKGVNVIKSDSKLRKAVAALEFACCLKLLGWGSRK
jgi:hypothetical protein